MSLDLILERGKKIIVDKLDVSENMVTEGASFKDDLGADSLDLVELIMELEDEFEIEIPDEEAETFVTVGNVVTYIKGKLSEAV